MKILWFTNTPCNATEYLRLSLFSGGWLSSLEKELSKNESIELYICFYYGKRIEPFKYQNTYYYPVLRKKSNSKIHRFISRVFNLNFDKEEIKELLAITEVIKPDLIHIHGCEENFGLIQKFTKIPVIISIQGLLSSIVEKYFSGIPYVDVLFYESIKSKVTFSTYLFSYRYLNKFAKREREILENSKYILGRTDWDKRITRILAQKSKYFISNEILRPEFKENRWNRINFNLQNFVIVSILSSGLYKGLESIVEASRIIRGNNLIGFKWLIIGQEVNDPLAKLIKRWKDLNFNDLNIEFMGVKTPDDIVKILLDSDIYCQVSHIENSPNSLCEAMQLGMPIVASFAGGTDSILENRKEGILIQDGDPYSLAGAIFELANDFNLSLYYGNNAHIRASTRHDKKVITNGIIKIYSDIISNENSAV